MRGKGEREREIQGYMRDKRERERGERHSGLQ